MLRSFLCNAVQQGNGFSVIEQGSRCEAPEQCLEQSAQAGLHDWTALQCGSGLYGPSPRNPHPHPHGSLLLPWSLYQSRLCLEDFLRPVFPVTHPTGSIPGSLRGPPCAVNLVSLFLVFGLFPFCLSVCPLFPHR